MRRHLRVTGVVQGVGFRPFVHRLALELELVGFVGNDSGGVFIEVEGPEERVARFADRLLTEAPPAARIAGVESQERGPVGEGGFRIVESRSFESARTLVSPDLATCEACLREVDDPGDRRFGYAFTNCTNCGPRYTILRETPYDRPVTTMAGFRLCPECRSEYDDPGNRRYHAQPNACPVCGPRLRIVGDAEGGGREAEGDPRDAAAEAEARGRADVGRATDLAVLRTVVERLADGEIVAIRGLGGYHLACDATAPEVVATLRERKGRPAKPLALMVPDLATAGELCRLDDAAGELLTSTARPIVLAPWREGARLEGVAPGNADVGVMLPYTPLHHLLLRLWAEHPGRSATGAPPVLVMTSANRSGEPIATTSEEVRPLAGRVADRVVDHDRPIQARADDSVMTTMAGGPVPLRRSRGYAPFPVPLPVEVPPTLAVGGELKATFCLAAGSLGFLSPHIGDMENVDTLEAFERAVDHMQALFGVEPERVVFDAHPGYLSARWARRRWPDRIVAVQHHHAHLLSLMAEHGLDGTEPFLGVALDGTGYGTDGTIWGGELLEVDRSTSRRRGHLSRVRLPGGEAAVRRPYRHALSLLHAAGIAWSESLPPVRMCRPGEAQVVAHQIDSGLASPWTSSAGRLFDGVAALLGLCEEVSYEGEAAIRLEAAAREGEPHDRYAFALIADDGSARDAGSIPTRGATGEPSAGHAPAGPDRAPVVLDPAPVLREIVEDLARGVPTPSIALGFHRALARGVAAWIGPQSRPSGSRGAGSQGAPRVGLSGGVFQNRTLTELTVAQLEREGTTVLLHRVVPPNDGGLALGQVLHGV